MKELKIGFVGRMGTGKTSLAAYMAYAWGANKYSLAGKAREIVRELLPSEVNERLTLINVGCKLREVDAGIWVNYLLRKISREPSRTVKVDKWSIENPIVIDDVRFFSEVKVLRENGFKIIRLCRPRDERIKVRPDLAYYEKHSSELEVDEVDVDYELYTGGDLRRCFKELDAILKEILEGEK